MKLSILERMLAVGALPEKGTFINLKLIRKAREALSFTEEENKQFNFKQDGDQVKWDDTCVMLKETGDVIDDTPDRIKWMLKKHPELYTVGPHPAVEIDLGETASKLIADALTDLDEKGDLTAQHLSLYEKFVEIPAAETIAGTKED